MTNAWEAVEQPPPVAARGQAAPAAGPFEGRALLLRGARVLTAGGLVAALFLAYELLLTGLTHDRLQPGLLAAFRQQLRTTTLGAASSVSAEGVPIALLSIPRIGVNEVVVEGTSPEDLKAGPGHLRTAPLPGEFGNAVIASRRTTYGAPFRHLDSLHRDDTIQVTTGQGSFAYLVTDVRPIRPGDPDPVTATADSRMTLLTSDPPYVASGMMTVTARLRGAPIAVANRPPVPTGSGDLGLAGDPLGLGLALAWGQLLAAAVWLTLRVRIRWPAAVTAMIAAPVILGLTVLTFSGLDRVLPGTL